MEKHGIAVATICTDEFFALGKAEAEALGMAGLPIAVVPHPVAKLSAARVAELAAGAVDEIVHIFGTDAAALQAEHRAKTVEVKSKLRYHSMFESNFNAPDSPQRLKGPDSWEAINRLFYRRGWTDGLPIAEPTPERCARMLAETGFEANEVLGLVEPRLGEATVGKVAVNAVMAGCEPAHLPVLVAAVRAMAQPQLNLKALQTTTHPCTLLALINGPLAEALDINGTYNCMGQGAMANATIGRAIRLILLNIGGAAPGILDRATMGTPAKYSFCFSENAAESPWEPLHVERGFEVGQSTVTVCGVEGPHNVNEHYGRSAEEILLAIGGTMATPGVNNSYLRGEIIVAFGPEHAEIVARDGFSKDDVRRFLAERAIIPAWHISEAQGKLYRERVPDRFIGAKGEGGLHIVTRPEEVMIVVAGGAGRHSAVIPSFGTTRSVTVPILDAQGKAI
jgi:hypothetical protein